jgi:two-component system chemotaxis response regulator CheY
MSKRILIVDDALSVRTVVRSTLEPEGFEVDEALDGKQGFEKLQATRYSLIITDINMPKLDGITLVRRIRADPVHKFTPILMMTTERTEARKEEAYAAGVRAWLTKPFTPERLLEAVRKMAGS